MKRSRLAPIVLAVAAACADAPARPVDVASPPAGMSWFDDVTAASKVDFDHRLASATDPYFMPHLMAGGVAIFDSDDDGRLDIYLVHGGGAGNRLLRQRPDGTFEDASAASGLGITGRGQGAAAGDVDNDGRVDLVVTEYGATRLFLNRGQGRFVEQTGQSGIDNPLWGSSSCFFDFDRDSWLDLAVVNYVAYDSTMACGTRAARNDFCGPASFPGSVSRLYRNRGPLGKQGPRFEDITAASGLGRTSGPGLGVACVDATGDHWPDVLVANDGQPNRLWVNQANGTFRDEAVERGLAYDGMGNIQGHMGVALGDVDGNGLVDFFVTHLTEETHTLWKQDPAGLFRDATLEAGLGVRAPRSTGFGAVFGDFDNDGDEDLAYVSGRVARAATVPAGRGASFWEPYAEPNRLFSNDGSGKFTDVSTGNAAFSGSPAVSRGLAAGDLNGDGGLDLIATSVSGPARIYRNAAPKRGHWLLVRAFDPPANRDAYGARITVVAGQRRWLRYASPSFSYISSSDPRAHFGLGSATGADAFEVVWPDGTAETFPGAPADRAVTLRKGAGTAPAPIRPAGSR